MVRKKTELELSKVTLEERLSELRRLKKRRLEVAGYEAYIPNKMQRRAHEAVSKTICYVGGNRAGKSFFGAMEVCFALTKNYPVWFPKERRFSGPVKIVISATEFAVVSRVIEPKLFSLLPREKFTAKRKGGYLSQLIFEDGSTVHILTSEMDNSAYEGADWDLAWCDEPQMRAKYVAIRRGLVDRGGQMILTFTPLTEPWMKEEIVDRADGVRISVFTVDIRDNKRTVAGTPILTEANIKDFERDLTDDERETRLHGKFFHLKGAIYKNFGEAHQKTESEMRYLYPDPVICVLDPHDRLPHHAIWAYVDSQDDLFIDYEISIHCELPDLAKTITSIEKERGYAMAKRLIDPNFGRRPARPGVHTSVIQELGRNGAAFYEANDDVALGHMITRQYLHYNRQEEITAVNKPKLFFSKERVPITIRSMKNLQYEEWAPSSVDKKDPREDQRQKETHGADTIRYLTISKPRYRVLKRGAVPDEELTLQPY